MKKTLITLVSAMAVVANSHALLVLNDTFSYPNGVLTTVSGGIWTAHSSGGSAPIGVTNGQVRVQMTSSTAEDVSASLAGAPYLVSNPGTNVYSGYTLFLSNTVPTLSGTYISHFRGTNSGAASDFGARVFLTATNTVTGAPVPAGKFRISIGNGAAATNVMDLGQIDQDFSTNTFYTIITRFVPATGLATIWVNPSLETDTSATAADLGTAVAPNPFNVFYYSLRQGAQTPAGTTPVWIDNLKVGTTFADALGLSPLISAIPNQTTPANTPVGPIGFTVQDGQTVASSLTVSSNSSNPTLIPEANIALATVGGTGGTNRTVTITPAAGQQGKATITLTVSDDTSPTPYSSPTTFQVTVGEPTISAIPNQITSINTPTTAIPFTVTDPENDTLVLSSNSSNPTLIAPADILISGSGSSRTVTLTPQPGQTGLATITINVTDTFNTNSTSFVVAVSPAYGLIFSDAFTGYLDGPLIGNGTWSTTPPAGTSMIVTNQTVNPMVQISEALTEDVNTGSGFSPTPFAPADGAVLYSGYTINMASLPTNNGDYFSHFKDGGTTFRAKIYASTNNAASGYYRIGIANAANTVSAQVANDLAPNTTYLVVSRYNVGTAESVVWVNPTSSLVGGAVATDPTTTATISQYGLRQTASEGILYLDNLKIGSSLADVATIPTLTQTLTNGVVNGQLVFSWGSPLFALQSAPAVNGPYLTIPGATSPYTNSLSGAQQYFRLKY